MASYRGTRNLSTGPPIGTVEIRLAAEFMERFGRACGESEIRSSWREICRWSGFRNSLHRQARSDQGPAVTWRWLTGVADVAKKQNDVMLPSQILGCSRFWDWRARQYAEARDFAAVVQLPTADRDIKLRLAAIALSCLLALPSDLRVMHALAGPYTASGLAMYAVDIILPYNERQGSPLNRSCAGQRPAARVGVAGPTPGLTCGFCSVGCRFTPVKWRAQSAVLHGHEAHGTYPMGRADPDDLGSTPRTPR